VIQGRRPVIIDVPSKRAILVTTYVLGAGSSRDAGYPFAKDMGRGLLEWMEKAEPKGIYDFRGAATTFRESCANAEDIEALLNWMQEAISHPGDCSLSARELAARVAHYNRPILIEGMRQWFSEIMLGPSISYKTFSHDVVQSGDTVISFNYDVSLDRELRKSGRWYLGDGYGFEVEGFKTGSPTRLLKLHGSINWRPLLFGGLRRGGAVVGPYGSLGRRPVFIDPDLEALGYNGETDPILPRSGGALLEMLVLPVREKQFFFATSFGSEGISFWGSLWNSAAEALRSSDRIVLCGYSLLPIDERACKMLLEDPEIKAPFEVCCGDDSERIVKRLQAAGRTARATDQKFFGDWVRKR
jgi:hypothetical protein